MKRPQGATSITNQLAVIGTFNRSMSNDYMPPLAEAVPLGVQHVLAMFVGNVTVQPR